jgi:hypothetical protein
MGVKKKTNANKNTIIEDQKFGFSMLSSASSEGNDEEMGFSNDLKDDDGDNNYYRKKRTGVFKKVISQYIVIL